MSQRKRRKMTEAENCRHEFVKIYQRKLKGLERRLVATKAYLPVGFKMADFGHLSEGSYCFCTKCRARLYPKRTNADRAQARLVAAAGKLAAAEQAEAELESTETLDEAVEETSEQSDSASISVEELEVDAVGLEELDEGTLPPSEEEESI
ncbi:MAG: hypothetical protein K2W95_36005 [Candidatus Obscuribacterales bacterium]|nr:hypothetical protein [Candidatus Obscuribacterales bacterium]